MTLKGVLGLGDPGSQLIVGAVNRNSCLLYAVTLSLSIASSCFRLASGTAYSGIVHKVIDLTVAQTKLALAVHVPLMRSRFRLLSVAFFTFMVK
jgi:hypothetical protein